MFHKQRLGTLLVCFYTLMRCHFVLGTLTNFKSDALCDADVKLERRCLTPSDQPANVVECAMMCADDDLCEGVCVDKSGSQCFLLRHCPGLTSVYPNVDQNMTYYARMATSDACLNGGNWNAAREACRCFDGFVGLRCERYAESCRELTVYGYGLQGNKKMFLQPPDFTSPFQTNCAIHSKIIRTDIVHQTINHFINNTRTWREYVEGFYATDNNNDERDFWLGLEKIHYLNQKANLTQLNIVLEFSPNLTSVLKYSNVSVSGPEQNYSLSYLNFNRIIGDTQYNFSDCFSFNVLTQFSTPDADNDQDLALNCAGQAGAGWWFRGCNPFPECNPLGVTNQIGGTFNTSQHMRFKGEDLQSYVHNLTGIRMYFSENL